MCIYTFTCLSVCVCICVKVHANCGTHIELRGQLVRVCSYFLPFFQEGPLLFLPLSCVPAHDSAYHYTIGVLKLQMIPLHSALCGFLGTNSGGRARTASVLAHQAISLASRRLAVWRETLFTYFHSTRGRIVLTGVSVAIQYLLGRLFLLFWGTHLRFF